MNTTARLLSLPAVLCPALSFSAPFVGEGLRGGSGALIYNLHTRTAVYSAPPPMEGDSETVRDKGITEL